MSWMFKNQETVLRRPSGTLAGDQRGMTAITTGLGLTVLLGFGGLAIDVANWLNAVRNMQSAADQGVYSAAAAAGVAGCPGGSPSTSVRTQASAIVAVKGFVNGQNDTTVTVTCPDAASFKVVISQPQP